MPRAPKPPVLNEDGTVKEKKVRTRSTYKVMQSMIMVTEDEEGNTQEGEVWRVVGEFDGINQTEAKRKAATHLNGMEPADGAEAAVYTLLAVSLASWKPITAKLERPAPKLVLS